MVPGRKHTMALKGSKIVTVAGATDKRNIIATFEITLSGNFLPMQLIYGGKAVQGLSRFQFPNSFSLSVNKKHYSDTKEPPKFINEIIIPFPTLKKCAHQIAFLQSVCISDNECIHWSNDK